MMSRVCSARTLRTWLCVFLSLNPWDPCPGQEKGEMVVEKEEVVVASFQLGHQDSVRK